jgi:hypothetical protein
MDNISGLGATTVPGTIRLDENDYHCFYSRRGDTRDSHEQSTSKLAWSIVGHPLAIQRAKELGAAAAKRMLSKT